MEQNKKPRIAIRDKDLKDALLKAIALDSFIQAIVWHTNSRAASERAHLHAIAGPIGAVNAAKAAEMSAEADASDARQLANLNADVMRSINALRTEMRIPAELKASVTTKVAALLAHARVIIHRSERNYERYCGSTLMLSELVGAVDEFDAAYQNVFFHKEEEIKMEQDKQTLENVKRLQSMTSDLYALVGEHIKRIDEASTLLEQTHVLGLVPAWSRKALATGGNLMAKVLKAAGGLYDLCSDINSRGRSLEKGLTDISDQYLTLIGTVDQVRCSGEPILRHLFTDNESLERFEKHVLDVAIAQNKLFKNLKPVIALGPVESTETTEEQQEVKPATSQVIVLDPSNFGPAITAFGDLADMAQQIALSCKKKLESLSSTLGEHALRGGHRNMNDVACSAAVGQLKIREAAKGMPMCGHRIESRKSYFRTLEKTIEGIIGLDGQATSDIFDNPEQYAGFIAKVDEARTTYHTLFNFKKEEPKVQEQAQTNTLEQIVEAYRDAVASLVTNLGSACTRMAIASLPISIIPQTASTYTPAQRMADLKKANAVYQQFSHVYSSIELFLANDDPASVFTDEHGKFINEALSGLSDLLQTADIKSAVSASSWSVSALEVDAPLVKRIEDNLLALMKILEKLVALDVERKKEKEMKPQEAKLEVKSESVNQKVDELRAVVAATLATVGASWSAMRLIDGINAFSQRSGFQLANPYTGTDNDVTNFLGELHQAVNDLSNEVARYNDVELEMFFECGMGDHPIAAAWMKIARLQNEAHRFDTAPVSTFLAKSFGNGKPISNHGAIKKMLSKLVEFEYGESKSTRAAAQLYHALADAGEKIFDLKNWTIDRINGNISAKMSFSALSWATGNVDPSNYGGELVTIGETLKHFLGKVEEVENLLLVKAREISTITSKPGQIYTMAKVRDVLKEVDAALGDLGNLIPADTNLAATPLFKGHPFDLDRKKTNAEYWVDIVGALKELDKRFVTVQHASEAAVEMFGLSVERNVQIVRQAQVWIPKDKPAETPVSRRPENAVVSVGKHSVTPMFSNVTGQELKDLYQTLTAITEDIDQAAKQHDISGSARLALQRSIGVITMLKEVEEWITAGFHGQTSLIIQARLHRIGSIEKILKQIMDLLPRVSYTVKLPKAVEGFATFVFGNKVSMGAMVWKSEEIEGVKRVIKEALSYLESAKTLGGLTDMKQEKGNN